MGRRTGLGARSGRRGIGAGGAWRPTMLPGCVLWLRADLGVTKDGSDKVSQWDDQSGNAHHVTQATGSKQPTWLASGSATGEAALEFDGVDDYLRATWVQAQPVTLLVVGKFLRAPATGETMIDGGSGNSMRYEEVGSVVAAQTTSLLSKATTVVAWHLAEIQFNGASGSLRIDAETPVTGNIGATSPGGICIGLYGNEAAFPSNCRVTEVAMYGRILTTDELARFRAYSTSKHAVP